MTANVEHRARILIADDDHATRVSLGAVLRHAGYEVDDAPDGEAAASRLVDKRFDLLLVDIDMPGNRSLELVHRVTENGDGPAVIIVTGHPSVATAVEALRMSVLDYLIKPVRSEELLERVSGVLAKATRTRTQTGDDEALEEARRKLGELKATVASLCQTLGSTSEAPPRSRPRQLELDVLSPRERQVAEQLTHGKSTTEIASALFISPNTVRNHLKSIYRKLGLSNRSQLLQRLLDSWGD
jgi:DNA-binding NarL/FixJ family response regulator